MAGVNKVILIGRLGKDCELRYFPDGGAVCNNSLATSESWKDKQTGERKERTEWHNLSFTGRLAEIVAEYTKKGSQIYVEGSLRTRKWEKDGVERFTTEVNVHSLQLLDGKPQGDDSARQQSPRGAAPRGQAQRQSPAAPPDDGGFSDDDIPF